MAFWSDLGKKISDTTQSVVEKTKTSTDTLRLNGLISDEERNVQRIYAEIGKKYMERVSGLKRSAPSALKKPAKPSDQQGKYGGVPQPDPQEQAPPHLRRLRCGDSGNSAVLHQVRGRESGGQAPCRGTAPAGGGRACGERSRFTGGCCPADRTPAGVLCQMRSATDGGRNVLHVLRCPVRTAGGSCAGTGSTGSTCAGVTSSGSCAGTGSAGSTCAGVTSSGSCAGTGSTGSTCTGVTSSRSCAGA